MSCLPVYVMSVCLQNCILEPQKDGFLSCGKPKNEAWRSAHSGNGAMREHAQIRHNTSEKTSLYGLVYARRPQHREINA
jgi:hypothetical protein